MKHKPEYKIGQRVRSAIAPEKHGIVTAITLRAGGVVQYLVCWAEDLREGYFHGFELTEFDEGRTAGFKT